jgi:hypothetical protein
LDEGMENIEEDIMVDKVVEKLAMDDVIIVMK